ncbi:hypothetical protein D3C86_1649140 [compost metagenome]
MKLYAGGEGIIRPAGDFRECCRRQRVDANKGAQSVGMAARQIDREIIGCLDQVGRVMARGNHHRALGQIGGRHQEGPPRPRRIHVGQQVIDGQRSGEDLGTGADPPQAAAIGGQEVQDRRGMDMDMMIRGHRLSHGGGRGKHHHGRRQHGGEVQTHLEFSERKRGPV